MNSCLFIPHLPIDLDLKNNYLILLEYKFVNLCLHMHPCINRKTSNAIIVIMLLLTAGIKSISLLEKNQSGILVLSDEEC